MTSRAAEAPSRSVLITRSEEDCAAWAVRFAELGAEPVSLPCIRCEPIATAAVKQALAAALPDADWLVFTSRRGVEAFAALDLPPPTHCRVAVVGETTAQAARTAFGRADVVGPGTAATLAAALEEHGALTPGRHFVLALAENAADTLERALIAAGARCTRVAVYRTVPAAPVERRRPVSSLHVDNVVLASPSAVTGFVRQIEVDSPVNVYTIGPSTTAAAHRAGLAVTAEAREPSLEGILEAMQWRK